jgi:hypothetical protein
MVKFRRLLLAGVLAALGLLPIWTVRYVPLYDYQTHLLEAQVVLDYGDPGLAYAPNYVIRDGWFLRSNALTTLLLLGLGRCVPLALAGKLVLSGYILLLTISLTALFGVLGKPWWLSLILPLFIYNLTFTSGLLNWSYGFALIPLALIIYMRWRSRGSLWALAALASVGVLIYTAHILAWGLMLILIGTLAAVDGVHLRGFIALGLVLSAATPLLAISRPIYAVAPIAILALFGLSGVLVRRLRLTLWNIMVVGSIAIVAYWIGLKVFRDARRAFLPLIGYSIYDKLIAWPHLFALPQHLGAIQWDLAAYNLLLLALLLILMLLMALERLLPKQVASARDWRWPAAFGALLLVYSIIPSSTRDIDATEPRVLLLAALVGFVAAPLPTAKTRRRAVIAALVMLGLSAPLVTLVWAQRYDRAARTWVSQLNELAPARRVLVLANPPTLPAGAQYHLVRAAQIFDPRQFSPTYALEHGGYVSNTFFNGPLWPTDSQDLPAYWQTGFDSVTFVDDRCVALRNVYDGVVVWNPGSQELARALQNCFGVPIVEDEQVALWRIP